MDVLVDTSKSTSNKPSNDSPIQLKIAPKAQWPLQRFISSGEVSYPIEIDNPLLMNDMYRNSLRKQSSSGSDSSGGNSLPHNFSPNSLLSYSPSLYSTAPTSLNTNHATLSSSNNNNTNDWIKMIEVSTHIGPHRRLFMGPQFVFKTFNSNLTTTMLNPSSSSVMSDVETPIIDLSGDIELNSLE